MPLWNVIAGANKPLDTPAPSWSIRGDYFETCSCTVVCPCLISAAPPLTSMPTEGTCDAGFAFHIDQGTFGDVPLDGLNVGLVAHVPGPMIEGNWTVALYLDERADPRQHEALQAIFSGATILPDGSPALIVDVGSLV